MRKTKPYLGGAINGCTDAEANDWRTAVKKYFPLAIDPMVRDYRGKEAENYREIVDLDKFDIRRSDVIVINYVKPSVGTSMETFYAWTLGKPIAIWCHAEAVISPWLRYHSTTIVHSLPDLVATVDRWSALPQTANHPE